MPIEKLYQRVFESSPVSEYLVSPSFTLLAVNEAFCRLCGRPREQLVGRNLFDVYPDPHASGEQTVRASIERVIATGQPHALPLQRYPVEVTAPDGTPISRDRYWSAISAPVADSEGRLLCVAHSTIDVTDLWSVPDSLDGDGADTSGLEGLVYTRAQAVQEINRALEAERNRLWHLFENAPGFVYFTREPGHVLVQANAAFLDLVGGGEAIGRPLAEAFPAATGRDLVALHDEVWRSGMPFAGHAMRILLNTRPGEQPERFIDVVFQPIVNAAGQVRGICGQGVDVTDRVRAERELRANARRQAWRLELSDRLRSIDDADTIVASASEMLGRALGATRIAYCELEESGVRLTIRTDWVDPSTGLPGASGKSHRVDKFGSDMLAVLQRGEVLCIDDVRSHARTADALAVYEAMQVRATIAVPLVKAGRLRAVLCAQKAEAYQWSDDEIEMCAETAERTWSAVEKAQAQDELREANRRKDEFLAMLAHELRNPLAPISAAAQLMQASRLDEARLRQTSQVISRQVAHMTELVDDLLDVSRVTRGLVALHRSPQDMHSVVANAIEQVRPLLEKKGHHLSVSLAPEPAQVLGDAKRLVQILSNLLNNACKYTPSGGHVSVSTTLSPKEVLLQVGDDGIGMDAQMQTRAFELFAQAERTPDRSQGGLGLGLALVKSLVELHGGQVWCTSDGLGRGSCFSVRLPRVLEVELPSAGGGAGAQRSRAGTGLQVLVVDDNADAAEMLALLLETSGHEVVVAHTAEAALSATNTVTPDACLLDIGLPGMDGKELARRLRAQPHTARALLVAVTGYGQEQDREEALAAGFDHHLVKPVDPARLIALLDNVAVT